MTQTYDTLPEGLWSQPAIDTSGIAELLCEARDVGVMTRLQRLLQPTNGRGPSQSEPRVR